MIRTIMFDHGGVLTRGGESGTNERIAAQLMGLRVPIQVPDLNNALKRGKIDNAQFVAEVNKRYERRAVRRLDHTMWDQLYDLMQPDPQAYAFARRCRAAGLRVGILSNISEGMAMKFVTSGAYEGFDPIVLSCYVGHAKPEAEIYQEVEGHLSGIMPDEILFLDDQLKCVQGAEKRGWKGCVVTSSEQMVQDAGALLGFK